MTTAHVRGTAHIATPPDRAELRVRAQATAPTDETAKARFATLWSALIDALDVEAADVRPEPPRSWSQAATADTKAQVHYTGWAHVSFTDLANISKVAEDLVNIPGINIDHISWDISNRNEVQRAARVAAITNARQVAEDYAAALDMKVFSVSSVSDLGVSHRIGTGPSLAAGATPGSSTSRIEVDLNPVDIDVSGSVDVVFSLARRGD